MKGTLRRYHRTIAIAVCFPLFVTALTGIGIAIAQEWFDRYELAGFLLKVHTFQLFGLSGFLPILNGLGLIGLIVTGISMTSLFSKRHKSQRTGERR